MPQIQCKPLIAFTLDDYTSDQALVDGEPPVRIPKSLIRRPKVMSKSLS